MTLLRDGLVIVGVLAVGFAMLALFGCAPAAIPITADTAAVESVDTGDTTEDLDLDAVGNAPVCATSPEFCNGRDDDCDGEIDEDALDRVALCLDDNNVGHRDGRGNMHTMILVCSSPDDGQSWIPDCSGDGY
jgi:hypothetical protein